MFKNGSGKICGWKTAFKKFEVILSAKPDFLKAVFHKFYFVNSGILRLIC